jgi:hypothetical protein
MIMKHSLLKGASLPLLLILLLIACDPLTEGSSELFRQIFFAEGPLPNPDADTTNFRGNILGQKVQEVLKKEKTLAPSHEDELGISYEIDLVGGATMLLEYYSDLTNRLKPKGKLTSIAADILLSDEVETARLYEEIETYLNQRYGISDGVYGDQTWNHYNSYTNNMEVRLVLHDNKKQITLNFVDLQPEQTREDQAAVNLSQP